MSFMKFYLPDSFIENMTQYCEKNDVSFSALCLASMITFMQLPVKDDMIKAMIVETIRLSGYEPDEVAL